jgi:hypothetical protein
LTLLFLAAGYKLKWFVDAVVLGPCLQHMLLQHSQWLHSEPGVSLMIIVALSEEIFFLNVL